MPRQKVNIGRKRKSSTKPKEPKIKPMLLHALPTENKSDTKVKCEIQQNRNEHEPHFSDHDIDNSA